MLRPAARRVSHDASNLSPLLSTIITDIPAKSVRSEAALELAVELLGHFFERNFRPLRITKLGNRAGPLTGYYEPVVDGSRFPTGIFKIPIHRRPQDFVPPLNSTGSAFLIGGSRYCVAVILKRPADRLHRSRMRDMPA
jgi:membrane-bound lytic murein transglycosylase